ncbi:MAG: efflux RND transporter periplasmic adaptor subunit [Candidatus Eiseniibacteriota bacterium]
MADGTTQDPTARPVDDQTELYDKLARDAARLMVVHEAGRILRSTHDREKLARELLLVIADAMFSTTGCVAALKGDALEILATHGMTDAQASALVSNPAEAAFWFAVADGGEPRQAPDLAREVAVPGTPRTRPALSVYVPLWLEDRSVGVLGLGPRVDGKSYGPADEEFVVSLASHLAIALASAELFTEKERRIEQLQVLLKISREITSTLDLERVLVTITQMIGMVVPNRRVTVGLVAGGAVTVQADSQRRIEPKAAASHPLLPALRWVLVARKRVAVHWSQLEADPKVEGRDVLRPLLDPGAGPRAIAILPLEDDQGPIGLMAIEFDEDQPPLAGEAGELVDILANQTTVAMRNAELYTRVPMIGMLEPLLRKAKGVPRGSRTWWTRVAVASAAAVGLLIPLPAAVSVDATVRPAAPLAVRAASAGLVDEVLVAEGQTVEAGTVVARLRRDELEMQLGQVRAALQRARAEGGRARSVGSLADLRARQAEFASLTEEQDFLEGELARTELKAPVRGVVLTPRVEQLRGRRLERGETFLDLADLATMEVEAIVPEQDIQGVQSGSKAQLRVYSYPERRFRGTIVRIAPRADEAKRFSVRVRVDNADGRLRPGMTGRARLDIPPRPFLWPFLTPIVRWLRFQLWV